MGHKKPGGLHTTHTWYEIPPIQCPITMQWLQTLILSEEICIYNYHLARPCTPPDGVCIYYCTKNIQAQPTCTIFHCAPLGLRTSYIFVVARDADICSKLRANENICCSYWSRQSQCNWVNTHQNLEVVGGHADISGITYTTSFIYVRPQNGEDLNGGSVVFRFSCLLSIW